MKNLLHKILTLSTHQTSTGQTVPTILGGELYDVGRFITVYGPAINHIHYPLAFCRKIDNSKYFVIAEESTFQKIDPEDKGETIEDLEDDWLIWNCDGNESDGEGGRRDVSGRIVKLDAKVTGIYSASKQRPVTVKGDLVVEKARPSIDCTIGGYDFAAVIEPPRNKRAER